MALAFGLASKKSCEGREASRGISGAFSVKLGPLVTFSFSFLVQQKVLGSVFVMRQICFGGKYVLQFQQIHLVI